MKIGKSNKCAPVSRLAVCGFLVTIYSGMKNIFIILLIVMLAVCVGLWTRTTRLLVAARNDAATAAELQRLVNELKTGETSPAVAPVLRVKEAVIDAHVDGPVLSSNSAPASGPLSTQAATVQSTPRITEATVNAIDRFDSAMDREFDRLEDREQKTTDAAEVTTIQKIKDKLSELDELYRRSDNATAPEEKAEIVATMQDTMGSIISLSRVDRNERLGKLATDIGYTDPDAVALFVREIDRIYHETHMDWAKLFNRAPPQ
jgi:hypothetical protein